MRAFNAHKPELSQSTDEANAQHTSRDFKQVQGQMKGKVRELREKMIAEKKEVSKEEPTDW